MPLVVELNNISQINKYKKETLIDTYILGIEELSLDSKLKLDVLKAKEVIEKIHKINKKVCLNCCKIFHEESLDTAREILESIGYENIDYVLFSDLGFYQMFKDKLEMIYYAPTYLTNSKDVEEYRNIIGRVVISNQINIEELKYIISNSNTNTIVNYVDVFGRNAIFYSKRELLTNYFKYKEKNNNPKAKNYYLIEEYRDEKYPIIEDEFGFHLYEYGFYYLLEELDRDLINNNLIIHTNFLNKESSEVVINIYLQYIKEEINLDNAIEELKKLDLPLYKGAYDMKTVLLKSEVKTNA